MQKLFLILLASLVLAPTALADRAERRAVGDGALAVSGANARLISVKGSGLIYGHIDQGTLTVLLYKAADTSPPQISGATPRIVGKAVVYSGSDIRFLFANGAYSIRLEGTGISISAVGRGTVTADGIGTPQDGTLTINSVDQQPLSSVGVTASFGGSGKATPALAGLAKTKGNEHQ
jgi:hypothetical protein